MTFDEESFISDVAHDRKREREKEPLFKKLEERKVVGFHFQDKRVEPVFEQKLLDEVYADLPEEELDDEWVDGLYEQYVEEQKQIGGRVFN